jgi:hypothetical protein
VVAGLALLAITSVGAVLGRVLLRPKSGVEQPIAFNHLKHTESLECDICHEFFRKAAHSGVPGLSTCRQCHESPQTDSAEEKKINQLAAAGQEQVFVKLFHLPDNVFYTHRRHVGIAKLDCATCHGAIAKTTSLPATPLVRITMRFCIDCHKRSGASVQCTRCHR